MQHPFAALAGEYTALLASMTITRADETRRVADRLIESKSRWTGISAATGVPIAWSLASFEREAGSNYRLSPAQGDPWNAVSRNVPRGRGPFPSFAAAAEDAYHLDALDAVGSPNWTWARACYEAELFNGFGYRQYGVHSPYVWAGTSVYDDAKPVGKYESDGKFTFGVRDQQLGIVPMLVMLIGLDSTLELADTMPPAAPPVARPPQAAPVGVGGVPDGQDGHDTKWLQAALNGFGAGLDVDGNYGRRTRAAVAAWQQAHGLDPDGLAGPLTMAALAQASGAPA